MWQKQTHLEERRVIYQEIGKYLPVTAKFSTPQAKTQLNRKNNPSELDIFHERGVKPGKN